MSTYRVATGHDVALGSLTVLSPQPDPGEGLRFTAFTRAADGSMTRQGLYFDFEWSEMSQTNYNTILGLFGITAADNANVTIYIRDETYIDWLRYNGVVQKPVPGQTIRWNVRPQDITIRVTDLEIAS